MIKGVERIICDQCGYQTWLTGTMANEAEVYRQLALNWTTLQTHDRPRHFHTLAHALEWLKEYTRKEEAE